MLKPCGRCNTCVRRKLFRDKPELRLFILIKRVVRLWVFVGSLTCMLMSLLMLSVIVLPITPFALTVLKCYQLMAFKTDQPKGDSTENLDEEQTNQGDGEQSSGLDVEEARLRASARIRQMVQITSSPLLAQTCVPLSLNNNAELSSSQNDFFKMLDEKIENGPDYDSSCEYEKALEHARLCRLLHDWETAKQRCRNRSAPTTPARKPLLHYYPLQTNGDIQRHQRPIYPHQYTMANSVVMYDKTRGSHYTELA